MPRAGWLALGAIGGALAANTLATGVLLPAASLLALAVAVAAIATGRRSLAAAALAAALVLGRAYGGELTAAVPSSLQPAPAGVTAVYRADVVSLGAPGGGQQRAVVRLLAPAAPDLVYARLPRYPALIPGDVVEFRGALQPSPTDPGFGEFLARSGIRFTTRVYEMERVGSTDTPLASLEQLRRNAGDAVGRALPEPQAGLATAILIGVRDVVSREVTEAFRVSGLSHVVAISGWHITLVGGVVASMLRGVARRPRSAVVLAAIIGYAILAGASPSVMRAALMAAVVLVARESGRTGQASAGLGLAATGMLLVEPRTIDDVGFQLSLTATAGLLCWAGPLGERLRNRLPASVPTWLIEALAVSLAAQAATLPLVLFHFGRLSLVAPLANLVVAPIVAPVMLASALALVGGALASAGLPGLVLAPITLFGSLAVGSMIAVADISSRVPLASVELPPPLDAVTAAIAAAWLVMVLRRRGPATRAVATTVGVVPRPPRHRHPAAASGHRRVALAALCGIAVVMAVVGAHRPDGRLRMTVLDVGQGDSILLEGPRGSRMLVDTGPDPDRLLSLLDSRIPPWDRRLDMVVITHPHEDHVAGLALLLDRYRVLAVGEPGMFGAGPGDRAFRERMRDLGRTPQLLAAGDRLEFDGVRVDVHWPLPGSVPLQPSDTGKGVNNVSIVLELRHGDRRLLLTGDVEEEIDPRLLAAGIDGAQPVDVLKVAHHGSGTATTDAFVERVRPRIAIVSAGWNNPYGHPSPATVTRLEAAGARLFRTDLDGSVEVSTDGHDLVAHASGGRPRPAAAEPPLPPGIGFCPIPTQAGSRRRPYNRRHGPALAHRSRAHPARAGPAGVARGPFGGRGRGGRLPRPQDRQPASGARHARRGGGGAAA